jgi:hypothetical protein
MKKETLEEFAEIWVHNRFTKQIKDEDIYASENSIVQSHILFAKWQMERSYSEEELKSAFKVGFNIGYGSPVQELDLKNEHCEKWFNKFKNK